MAERLTTNQEVPGSTPGWIGDFSVLQFLEFLSFCNFLSLVVGGGMGYPSGGATYLITSIYRRPEACHRLEHNGRQRIGFILYYISLFGVPCTLKAKVRLGSCCIMLIDVCLSMLLNFMIGFFPIP